MYLSIENDPRSGPLLNQDGHRVFGRAYADFSALIADLGGEKAEEAIAQGLVVLRPGIAQSAPETAPTPSETAFPAPEASPEE